MQLPTYDDIIPAWIDAATANGVWDLEHGSDVFRFLDDVVRGGVSGAIVPAGLSVDEFLALDPSDPVVLEVVRAWSVVRHAYVMGELPSVDGPLRLARTMRVDSHWIGGILAGTETTGVHYGEIPLDSGDFWIDQEMPVEVYFEVEVDPADVDWPATILLRMDYVTGDEEREVRIRPNARVTILSMEVDCEPDDRFVGVEALVGTARPRPVPKVYDEIDTAVPAPSFA